MKAWRVLASTSYSARRAPSGRFRREHTAQLAASIQGRELDARFRSADDYAACERIFRPAPLRSSSPTSRDRRSSCTSSARRCTRTFLPSTAHRARCVRGRRRGRGRHPGRRVLLRLRCGTGSGSGSAGDDRGACTRADPPPHRPAHGHAARDRRGLRGRRRPSCRTSGQPAHGGQVVLSEATARLARRV